MKGFMSKPPFNQPEVKEIILRYVKLDPSMRPIDIKSKLLKDHGIVTTRNYIGRTRTTYLEALDIESLQVGGRRLRQVDRLLGRLKSLRYDLDNLIIVLEKQPPTIEKKKIKIEANEEGMKQYTYKRTKEKQDLYNANRRAKAKRIREYET